MPQIQPVVPDREPQSKDRTTFSRIDRISRYLTREKRLRLVVNELGHRTKNLLAVVQAIATQTAQRSSDLNAFRSEFSQRIGALSRSLDLLIHEGERGVSVAELVQRQLEPFAEIDGPRIVMAGPDALLNREATQTLGLALNELATNATKYGALSVPEGTISVHWELVPGGSGPERFRLIWCEQSGPAVTPPEHQGFGSMILQRIAAATLGGNARHDFDGGGVRWTLEVPTAAILMVKSNTVSGARDR